MSTESRVEQFLESVSTRWQIPLLGMAGVLLIGGLVQLRTEPLAVSFAQHQDDIRAFRRAGLFADALTRIDRLLEDDELTNEERGWLHQARAQTFYMSESGKRIHDEANLKQIVDGYDRAKLFGIKLSAETHRQLGDTAKWSGDFEGAIRSYRKALSAGVADEGVVLRELVALELLHPEVHQEQPVLERLDALIKASGPRRELLIWALERKFDLLTNRGDLEGAKKLLADHAEEFEGTAQEGQFNYLIALGHYKAGRYDESERLLRAIRSRIKGRNDFDAKTAWLLGMVNLADDRPQMALSMFGEVLGSHPSGSYVTGSRLGQAECLAALERYGRSAEAYDAVLQELARTGDNAVVNMGRVRTLLTAQYKTLLDRKELSMALGFLQMATETIPADSQELLVVYVDWLAGLHSALGSRRREMAEKVNKPELADARVHLLKLSRAHTIAAADAYLRYAKLNVLQEDQAADAVWQAADHFDSAGERERTIEVLEAYIRERPGSAKMPEALFRLGQAYQAMGRYTEAIKRYQLNQQQFPRSVPATQSLVPMAACYQAMGPEHYKDAEETLLVLVEDNKVVRPEAPEFKAALFALSELYVEQGAYEKAIRRLEEVLARYPEEERAVRCRFLLAHAYRKSAQALAKMAAEVQNAVHHRYMTKERTTRLERSVALFEEVAARYEERSEKLSELEKLYVEQSYLYRADGLFELGRDDEALRAYRDVVGSYPNSPAYLSASVQLIRLHLRHGRIAEARAALWNAQTRASVMDKDAFANRSHGRSQEQWTYFLESLVQLSPFATDADGGQAKKNQGAVDERRAERTGV